MDEKQRSKSAFGETHYDTLVTPSLGYQFKVKDESFIVKEVDRYANSHLSESCDNELSFGTRPTTLYQASGISIKNESTDMGYESKSEEETEKELRDTSNWIPEQKKARDHKLKVYEITETEEKLSDIQMLLDRINQEREQEKKEKEEGLKKINNLENEMREVKNSIQNGRNDNSQMMTLMNEQHKQMMASMFQMFSAFQNQISSNQIQAQNIDEEEVGM